MIAALRDAGAACLAGELDGLVTGPVHKASINAGGIAYTGTTELLAAQAGVEVVMMLANPRLRVALATTHLPLRAVPDAITGPTLTPAALQTWRSRIDHDPVAYTLQRFMPYAQAPVWSEGRVAMRGASLRVYALSDGRGGWQVLPGGMTRIATRDAGPVSMQLGGSSLDTWVMTDGPVDTFSMLPATVKLDELVQRQRPVASRTCRNEKIALMLGMTALRSTRLFDQGLGNLTVRASRYSLKQVTQVPP